MCPEFITRAHDDWCIPDKLLIDPQTTCGQKARIHSALGSKQPVPATRKWRGSGVQGQVS